jgi:hypothetical protein
MACTSVSELTTVHPPTDRNQRYVVECHLCGWVVGSTRKGEAAQAMAASHRRAHRS